MFIIEAYSNTLTTDRRRWYVQGECDHNDPESYDADGNIFVEHTTIVEDALRFERETDAEDWLSAHRAGSGRFYVVVEVEA